MKGIKPSQIRSLYLYGISMGCFGDGSSPAIVVSDPRLIRTFYNALDRATTNSTLRLGNGFDTLEIHLKPKNGIKPEPLMFPFNPQLTNHWYGPEFKSALDELAKFQAQQARQKVSNLTPMQLQSARVGKTIITDPDQLVALLKALHHVDSQAYAYTTFTRSEQTTNLETLRLTLKNGRTVDLRFFLSHYAPNAVVKPLWDLYSRVP